MKVSTCSMCKNPIKFDPTKSYGKFCTNRCQADFLFITVTVKRVEFGLVNQASTLRNYLSRTRGYHCEVCKVSKWQNKDISLHVDHIDGNSDNNMPANLRLMCPNCHSQTDTFCGRNQKNSKRSTYRQRYRRKALALNA